MKLAIHFLSAVLCISASLSALGQNSPGTTGTATEGSTILREYDQAIDEVAERAMHSVVQIEVTGFGKPESSSDDDQDPAALQRQRVIGSGLSSIRTAISSPTTTWSRAHFAFA